MQKSVKLLICGALVCFSSLTYAVPSPLGLKLGKANLSDVKLKYKVNKTFNLCEGISDHYFIFNLKKSNMKGAQFASLTLDKDKIVQDVFIYFDKSQYPYLLKSLTEKYYLIGTARTPEGEEHTYFLEGDCKIILQSPSKKLNQISIRYVSKIEDYLAGKCNQKLGIY